MRNKRLGFVDPELHLSSVKFLDNFSRLLVADEVQLSQEQMKDILERNYGDLEFRRTRRNFEYLAEGQTTYEHVKSTLSILTDVEDVDQLLTEVDVFMAKLYHILTALHLAGCEHAGNAIGQLVSMQVKTIERPRARDDDFDINMVLLIGTYLKYNHLIDQFLSMVESSTIRNLRKYVIYLTI